MSLDRRQTFDSVDVTVGGMAPPLHEQLGCDAEMVQLEQRMLDGLLLLRVHGIIPPAVAWEGTRRVIQRLTDKPVQEAD